MLKELQALLADSEGVEIEEFGDFEDLPDGTYEAILENFEFKESQAGNLMGAWHFIIEGGQYANRHHFKNSMLTSAENMKRLTTALSKFGVDTASMASIEDGLDKIVEMQVKLKISRTTAKSGKWKGTEFVNTAVSPLD